MFVRHIISYPLIRYVLLSALRDKVLFSILFIIALALSLSVFLGSSALVEKNASVSVYSAGAIRFAGVLGLILFVVFYIRRSFDSRDVDFLLSRPLSRLNYVTSHFIAFSIIALCFMILSALAVLPFASGVDLYAKLLWTLSLGFEYIIMATAAMFFAMVISSASASALVTLSFYVLARLIGQLLNIVASGKVDVTESQTLSTIVENIMVSISLFVPRLDLMAQTSWLIYGVEGLVGYGFVFYHGIVFSLFLLCATLIDLLKREF